MRFAERLDRFFSTLGSELTNRGRNREAEVHAALNSFLSALLPEVERLRAERHAQAVEFAPDFDVFRYIARDENALSDVIADLLRPDGAHGQGRTFLDCFLDLIRAPDVFRRPDARVAVLRERVTDAIENRRRRIDIVVEFRLADDKVGVGIENKPWHLEGDEQLADYDRHLSNDYRGRYMLVFLAGGEQEISSLSEERQMELAHQDRFRELRYGAGFRRWLEQCHEVCRAEKVKWFLSCFTDYVDGEFGSM